MTSRLTVDGVHRPWNLPTTTVYVGDPTKLPIGIVTEYGDEKLLSWYGLLQADDDAEADTVRMDLSELRG